EQVAVQPGEVAVDPLLAGDRLDAVDGGGVARGGQRRRLGAAGALQLGVAVVEGVGQVGGGPAGLAAGDRAVVQHDDRLARAGQQVGGTEAGDAGADDADV